MTGVHCESSAVKPVVAARFVGCRSLATITVPLRRELDVSVEVHPGEHSDQLVAEIERQCLVRLRRLNYLDEWRGRPRLMSRGVRAAVAETTAISNSPLAAPAVSASMPAPDARLLVVAGMTIEAIGR